jgi:glycosyltransferase involved in cell wall biosynthesis
MPYKHQLEVVQAVHRLQQAGLPVKLELVGPRWNGYGRRLQALLDALDPRGERLVWHGEVEFATLHEQYHSAELFVFASSCENLPNILLEAMAAGLPIACAERGPMPEVLGEAGVYFDPDDTGSIADAIKTLALNTDLRERVAMQAYQRSLEYSWETCAKETLEFLARIGAQANTN